MAFWLKCEETLRSHLVHKKFHKKYNFLESKKMFGLSNWSLTQKMKELYFPKKFTFHKTWEVAYPTPLR